MLRKLATLVLPALLGALIATVLIPTVPDVAHAKGAKGTPPVSKGADLAVGQNLKMNEYLADAGGGVHALLQVDGNFCVYDGAGPGANTAGPVWCTGIAPGVGFYFATLQADGNLCVYKGLPESRQGMVWCSSKLAASSSQRILRCCYDRKLWVYHVPPESLPKPSFIPGAGSTSTGLEALTNIHWVSGPTR